MVCKLSRPMEYSVSRTITEKTAQNSLKSSLKWPISLPHSITARLSFHPARDSTTRFLEESLFNLFFNHSSVPTCALNFSIYYCYFGVNNSLEILRPRREIEKKKEKRNCDARREYTCSIEKINILNAVYSLGIYSNESGLLFFFQLNTQTRLTKRRIMKKIKKNVLRNEIIIHNEISNAIYVCVRVWSVVHRVFAI